MTAGFQIFGDNGNTQIDENYFNFACVAKGTINMPATVPDSNGYKAVQSVYLTIDADYPMLFLNPKSTMAAVQRVKTTGRSHEFRIVGGMTEGSVPQAESFSWFLFDKPPAPPANGSGIQVFNDAGQCVFDSNYPPMRFMDIITVPTNSSTGSWTYPPGDYALTLGQGRRFRVAYPVANQAGVMDVFTVGSTEVRMKPEYYQFGGPGNSSQVCGGGGKGILIDVSRL
jgi:hypothetical protein